ncbi:MAG: hypothetical protein EZS28_044848 [Streblomastix strix]|uniref:Uncharacterized protein n=1 Tax=Streblomastix strix TaxID=222440 RepID=A0A5J4TQH7_9EUKA|nr:MAG: hypothetical protein EZS28_044848 [Streblomastix strix]
MVKIIDSHDHKVVAEAFSLIEGMINCIGKKDEQRKQNPFCQSLIDNGIVDKLIQHIDSRRGNYNIQIAHLFAYLFKAAPLPSQIRKQVIDQLFEREDFDKLLLLAECRENQDDIIANDLGSQFNKDLGYFSTIDIIHLINKILELGSNSNKAKIALATNKKLYILTNDEEEKIRKKSIKTMKIIVDIFEQVEEEGQFEDIDAISIHSKQK